MATKRSIKLRGTPEVNEYGVAGEAIKPGYLVKGVTTVLKATSTTQRLAAVALERDELGRGIDDTYRSYAGAAAYAAGDRVKVAVFKSGEEALMYVPSGQNIAEDDLLESNGDGRLKEGSTAPIARAMEALGVVSVETALRVQFI